MFNMFYKYLAKFREISIKSEQNSMKNFNDQNLQNKIAEQCEKN